MQLALTLSSDRDIVFNHGNSSVLQGMFYKKFDQIGARYIHNEGYTYNNKTFRHFCFSDILSDYSLCDDKQTKNYGKTITLVFATALEHLVAPLCDAFYSSTSDCQGHRFRCTQIRVINSAVTSDITHLKTLSPVVVDKTTHHNGKKMRLPIKPNDPQFASIITKNLIDKYYSLYPNQANLVEPLQIISCKNLGEAKRSYKKAPGATIVAHHIELSLAGNSQLIQLALGSGLGSKNTLGFGLVARMD